MGEPAPQLSLLGDRKMSGSVRDDIYKRQTPELIIAFCGAVGSGVSTVAKEMQRQMARSQYDYKVEYIKVSEIIKSLESTIKTPIDETWYKSFSKSGSRIGNLQEAGDALRKDYSHDVLAQFVIGKINQIRAEKHLSPDGKKKLFSGQDPGDLLRVVWIIDSLKHPEEVDTLRAVYGNMFYLVGVLCPTDKRESRLKEKEIEEAEAKKIIEKDKSDPDDWGQQLIETIHRSDFFINNSAYSTEPFKSSIERYIEILFGEIKTPTKEEYAMYVAQSAAYNSACLSRQVGSSIMDDNGIVISYGCNDVPKCGGGLYSSEDGAGDNRCYRTHDAGCKNTKEKDRIKNTIRSILDGKLKDVTSLDKILDEMMKKSGIKNLTEYSKAVHAEMDSILKLARNGHGIPKNSSMFVTTYPCHNCAKHIVASGITKVYYIEPYEKSLAQKLHYDSITSNPDSGESKVKFIPFDGVAPRQFQKFFKMHGERKKVEIGSDCALNNIIPISEKFLDTYGYYEGRVLESLQNMNLLDILGMQKEGGSEHVQKKQGKVE